MESRNIIRAGFPDLFEISGFHLNFLAKNDRPCLFILYNSPLRLSICHLFTGRLDTMATLVCKEIPGYPISTIPRDFRESNQFPRIKGEVRRILMVSAVDRFLRWSFIPLLAGYLTASTSSTLRRVDEERFSFHHLFHLP
jgi:hypothetical protein